MKDAAILFKLINTETTRC